jgi:hypothetical protein
VEDIKQNIIDTVDDLVANFLFYDRKEDEDLTLGAIEEAIKDGTITIRDIVEKFEIELRNGLKK